ncbi:MAG: hypothetical protein ACM3OO_07265 [Planctomycetaceae bacterium]
MTRTAKAIASVALVTALVGTIPGAAQARSGDVTKKGSCSGASVWKLRLRPEDGGRIQVEYEVDSNKVGQTWRVRIAQNGTRIFAAKRVTKAPSGSFTVHLRTDGASGTDAFKAKAANASTGETCLGRASI